jgi:hypothetical protein
MRAPARLATCAPAGSLPVSARVVENAFHLPGGDQQCLEDIRRKSGAADDVFDGERALRDVGCMLEQADIAGHQGRSGEAEDLPEGEVPRHDGEDGSDGLVTNIAAAGAHVDSFFREQALAVFDVVAAGEGAFGGLGARGSDGLSHLEGHGAGEGVFLRFEDVGGGREPAGAIGEGSAAVGAKRRMCARQAVIDLRSGQGIERAQGFTGGGVDGSDHTHIVGPGRGSGVDWNGGEAESRPDRRIRGGSFVHPSIRLPGNGGGAARDG